MSSFELVIPESMQESYDNYQFPAAVRAGDQLILSGRLGYDADGIFAADISGQIACAFESIGTVLKEAGLDYSHIISITSHHVGDIKSQFKPFIDTKAQFITGPQPAWSAVEVAGLVRPEALIEIAITARFPD